MTYTSDIPVSGESLGSTRDRIRVNFQEIASVVAVNHVAFNALGEGKHKFLQMPEQGSAPTTAADEGGLYTKVGTNPAQTNLFFRGESNGTEYQLTRVNSASASEFGTNTNYPPAVANQDGGWTFLPGGLLLQYGKMTETASGSNVGTPVVFPIAYSTFLASVTATRRQNNSGTEYGIISEGLTGFNFTSSGNSNQPFYWIAIGK